MRVETCARASTSSTTSSLAGVAMTEEMPAEQFASFSFRVEQDDLVRGALLCARANPRIRRLIRRRTLVSCAVLAVAALVLLLVRQPIASVVAWTLLAGIPITALIAPRVFWLRLKRMLRQTIGSRTQASVDHQWRFSAEGIRKTSAQMATEIRWTAVQRLLAGHGHLALLNAADAALATIPRRAFADAASEAHFRAEVERFSGRRFENTAL